MDGDLIEFNTMFNLNELLNCFQIKLFKFVAFDDWRIGSKFEIGIGRFT